MRWTRNFLRDEEGSILGWVGGGIVVIVGMGAIGVDVGNLYLQETRMRVAADAAVLAAARELNNGLPAVRAAAIDYAEKNLDPVHFGTVLANSDQHEPRRQPLSASVVDPEWEGLIAPSRFGR